MPSLLENYVVYITKSSWHVSVQTELLALEYQEMTYLELLMINQALSHPLSRIISHHRNKLYKQVLWVVHRDKIVTPFH